MPTVIGTTITPSNNYKPVRWIVAPQRGLGDFQTITAALAASTSGTVVLVRPGTYTENITIPGGVVLTAFDSEINTNNSVVIAGTVSCTGSAFINGFYINGGGGAALSLSGTGRLIVKNCRIEPSTAHSGAVGLTASSNFRFDECYFLAFDDTVPFFNVAGELIINDSDSELDSAICTVSGATEIYDSTLTFAFNSSAGHFYSYNTTYIIENNLGHVIGSNNARFSQSTVSSGTASALTVNGTGCTLTDCSFYSSNASIIAGSTVPFISNLTLGATLNTAEGDSSSFYFQTPAAYPYTVKSYGNVILASSAAPNTIVLPNSPPTGKVFHIKDVTGTASTNNITITTVSGTVGIDGGTTLTLSVNYQAVTLMFNGTNYNVISDSTSGGAPPPNFIWSVVTGATQVPVTNHGYFANNAVEVVFTLPATAAVGHSFKVAGMNNATGWKIAQNAGQTIYLGASTTTPGVGGYLQSSATYDTVSLYCNVANTSWIANVEQGNIKVV